METNTEKLKEKIQDWNLSKKVSDKKYHIVEYKKDNGDQFEVAFIAEELPHAENLMKEYLKTISTV